MKKIIRDLLKESKQLYHKLLEYGAEHFLEEYLRRPFSEMEMKALQEYISKDKMAIFKEVGVDISELINEISLKLDFINNLYSKGIINNKIYYDAMSNYITFDVDVYKEERYVICLVFKMIRAGLINCSDYPDKMKELDNNDEEFKKEVPLSSYDDEGVVAIACVLGFKDGMKNCNDGMDCEFLRNRGIDYYKVSMSVILYGGYIYPCKSALELVDVISILQRYCITYLGIPRKSSFVAGMKDNNKNDGGTV